jgi:site-specific DNA recombinase
MNGSCANGRSITRTALEARMLEGLRARLMAPEIAAEAMRAYAEETNRLNRERRAGGEADRKALADVEKKLKEIVTAIEDGGYSRPLMMRLRDLEAKQDELTERLSRVPVDIPDIHPNVAGIYRRKVERLAEALQRPQERDEAAEGHPCPDRPHHTHARPQARRDRRHAARRPRHDPRMDGPKTEHSRPEWLGSVGFGGCGGRI